jgi:hypothetical protein
MEYVCVREEMMKRIGPKWLIQENFNCTWKIQKEILKEAQADD